MIIDLLVYAPLTLTLAAWLIVSLTKRWPHGTTLAALVIATANSVFAAWNSFYYQLKPSPNLPPWKDPQILNYGLLFLSAPIAMIVSSFAATRETAKWLIYVIWIASVPLFLIGLLAGAAV